MTGMKSFFKTLEGQETLILALNLILLKNCFLYMHEIWWNDIYIYDNVCMHMFWV